MKPTPAGLSLPGRRHPCARHGSEAGTLGARRAARESARAWRVSPRRATALSGSALPLGLCIRPASCHRQPCSLFPAGPSESSAKTENTLINVTGNTALAPPERSILQRRRRLAPRPLRPLRATLRLAERPGLRSSARACATSQPSGCVSRRRQRHHHSRDCRALRAPPGCAPASAGSRRGAVPAPQGPPGPPAAPRGPRSDTRGRADTEASVGGARNGDSSSDSRSLGTGFNL